MNALLLVAGGSGRRMGRSKPKQYLELGGKAVIVHTLHRFLDFDPAMKIVVVIAPGHREYWKKAVSSLEMPADLQICEGGRERFDSVRKGLAHIPDGMIVGIHDAVRPLVSMDCIRRCYDSAGKDGSAIPVIAMDESVRQLDPSAEGGSRNLERSALRRVQTPQTFRSELIRRAYEQVEEESFTDDASVFETVFGKLSLVEGNSENIKITTASDLRLASLLI